MPKRVQYDGAWHLCITIEEAEEMDRKRRAELHEKILKMRRPRRSFFNLLLMPVSHLFSAIGHKLFAIRGATRPVERL